MRPGSLGSLCVASRKKGEPLKGHAVRPSNFGLHDGPPPLGWDAVALAPFAGGLNLRADFDSQRVGGLPKIDHSPE